jgi:RNA polymerase sigma-70 factor, ECF subfamily
LSSVERRAFHIARLAVGHPQEALDIVQDAMMKLVQYYADRPQQEWRSLFFKIIENRIMDWHRRQIVRNRWRVFLDKIGVAAEQSHYDASSTKFNDCDQFADPNGQQPWQQVHTDQGMDTLNNALAKLPIRQQQAFLLRAWEGLSLAETASAMGCSQGSVKTHYSRARQSLRDTLKEYVN